MPTSVTVHDTISRGRQGEMKDLPLQDMWTEVDVHLTVYTVSHNFAHGIVLR